MSEREYDTELRMAITKGVARQLERWAREPDGHVEALVAACQMAARDIIFLPVHMKTDFEIWTLAKREDLPDSDEAKSMLLEMAAALQESVGDINYLTIAQSENIVKWENPSGEPFNVNVDDMNLRTSSSTILLDNEISTVGQVIADKGYAWSSFMKDLSGDWLFVFDVTNAVLALGFEPVFAADVAD